MTRNLAIDLGTANTLVYVRGKGVQLNQPTVIALNQKTGDILAMGDDAHAMIGRTPAHIVAVRPLRGGAISDFDTTARLLKMLLQRVGVTRLSGRPKVVVCVPSAITEVERRAVQEAAIQAGAKAAFLIEEPMAAAIGAGLPVHEPAGNLVVDVGGGTTEVACISLGGIVVSKAIRVGGFDLDAAIQQHIRREYAVAIGERTAEDIKIQIGSAYPQPGDAKAEIRGREIATGLPKTIWITGDEVREALDDAVAQIVQAVLETVAAAPPELANDMIDKGIVLTGGSSQLRGLDTRIAEETHVPVHLTETPLECVVLGAGQVVESLDELAPMLASGS
jgi:rod shape-determining protein MreB and related proteins